MNEQRFLDHHGAVLAALRLHRGECPDMDRLLAAIPDDLDGDHDPAVADHLELCPTCAAVVDPVEIAVDDVTWSKAARRLDSRRKPWLSAERSAASREFRRPLLIAATLIIVFAAATIWRQFQPDLGPPPDVSTQRGPSIQAIEPSGSIDGLAMFRWRTVIPLDLEYRVELARDQSVLWHAVTGEKFLEAPADLVGRIEPGRPYRWRVLGIDHEAVVAESGWVVFTVER
jgi:hypothetical protein